jgi:predicted MFS family arabinose efflux permease
VSKLALAGKVGRQYDPASLQDIVRRIEQQVNQLSEGAIAARHGAMTAAPTAGTWIQGDVVDNSSPSELGSVGSKYVIIGWICSVSGTPGTWLQMRCLTGN